MQVKEQLSGLQHPQNSDPTCQPRAVEQKSRLAPRPCSLQDPSVRSKREIFRAPSGRFSMGQELSHGNPGLPARPELAVPYPQAAKRVCIPLHSPTGHGDCQQTPLTSGRIDVLVGCSDAGDLWPPPSPLRCCCCCFAIRGKLALKTSAAHVGLELPNFWLSSCQGGPCQQQGCV